MLLAATLWLLAALLALLIAILATPVRVSARVTTREAAPLSVRARIISPLGPTIQVFPSGSPDEKPKPARPKRKRRKTRSRPSISNGARIAAALPRLISDSLSIIRIDKLNADIDFGFANPADTGEVYGMACPLIYATPSHAFQLRPHFDGERFEGDAEGAIRLIPLAIAPAIARFTWRAFLRPRWA